jgi:hypothetical protein
VCRHLNEALQVRLGQALARNTHLVELLLANCVIRDAGAVAFAKGLEANTSITLVNLESNRYAPLLLPSDGSCKEHGMRGYLISLCLSI